MYDAESAVMALTIDDDIILVSKVPADQETKYVDEEGNLYQQDSVSLKLYPDGGSPAPVEPTQKVYDDEEDDEEDEDGYA